MLSFIYAKCSLFLNTCNSLRRASDEMDRYILQMATFHYAFTLLGLLLWRGVNTSLGGFVCAQRPAQCVCKGEAHLPSGIVTRTHTRVVEHSAVGYHAWQDTGK
jgi:hypothetical protein